MYQYFVLSLVSKTKNEALPTFFGCSHHAGAPSMLDLLIHLIISLEIHFPFQHGVGWASIKQQHFEIVIMVKLFAEIRAYCLCANNMRNFGKVRWLTASERRKFKYFGLDLCSSVLRTERKIDNKRKKRKCRTIFFLEL